MWPKKVIMRAISDASGATDEGPIDPVLRQFLVDERRSLLTRLDSIDKLLGTKKPRTATSRGKDEGKDGKQKEQGQQQP